MEKEEEEEHWLLHEAELNYQAYGRYSKTWCSLAAQRRLKRLKSLRMGGTPAGEEVGRSFSGKNAQGVATSTT